VCERERERERERESVCACVCVCVCACACVCVFVCVFLSVCVMADPTEPTCCCIFAFGEFCPSRLVGFGSEPAHMCLYVYV